MTRAATPARAALLPTRAALLLSRARKQAVLLTTLLLTTSTSAQPPVERPRVLRNAIAASERILDKRFAGLFGVDDPFAVQGVPRGVYIESYGAVFTVEVNLLQAAGISPFRQTVSKEEIARVHQRKAERIPQLKAKMQSILIDTAAGLDPVPANDHVALGVSLFYAHWEDTSGLPLQIVMSAPRKALIDLAKGAGNAASIQVREY